MDRTSTAAASKSPSKEAKPHHPMSKWSMMAIACLVILVVSAGLALYYGVAAPNPTGTYASYVCYAMIVVLIVLAIMGRKLEHHTVIVHTKTPKTTKKAVSTGAGTIQMAAG